MRNRSLVAATILFAGSYCACGEGTARVLSPDIAETVEEPDRGRRQLPGDDLGRQADVVEDSASDSAAPDRAQPDDTPVDGGLACDDTLDLAPFTLHSDYCVFERFPVPTPSALSAPVAFSFDGLAARSLHEDSAGNGNFFVESWRVEPSSNSATSSSQLFSVTASVGSSAIAGTYLASGPGSLFAMGWRDDVTNAAEIVVVDNGSEAETIDGATFNSGFHFVDASSYLIAANAIGEDRAGSGVYSYDESGTTRIIGDLGALTAGLHVGDDVLYARGFYAPDGLRLYAFTMSEVAAAMAGSSVLTATTDGDLVDQEGDFLFDQAAVQGNDLFLTKLHRQQTRFQVVQFSVRTTDSAVVTGEPVIVAEAEERGVGGQLAATDSFLAMMVRAEDGSWDMALLGMR